MISQRGHSKNMLLRKLTFLTTVFQPSLKADLEGDLEIVRGLSYCQELKGKNPFHELRKSMSEYGIQNIDQGFNFLRSRRFLSSLLKIYSSLLFPLRRVKYLLDGLNMRCDYLRRFKENVSKLSIDAWTKQQSMS